MSCLCSTTIIVSHTHHDHPRAPIHTVFRRPAAVSEMGRACVDPWGSGCDVGETGERGVQWVRARTWPRRRYAPVSLTDRRPGRFDRPQRSYRRYERAARRARTRTRTRLRPSYSPLFTLGKLRRTSACAKFTDVITRSNSTNSDRNCRV